MWEALRPKLKGLDPIRVENHMVPGTPDVNYAHGWIELKYAPEWPRAGGPLRIDHYTQEQRVWAVRRERAGGHVFLLLKVGNNEWLLFNGRIASAYLGKSTREELYAVVIARWERLPRTEELLKCLSK